MILDTHAWLWFLLDDEHLAAPVKQQIDYNPAACYISAISVWEACLLIEHGRLEIQATDPYQGIRDLVRQTPIKVAAVNEEIAILSRELKFKHEDPADRLIAATAKAYQLPLVTADKNLKNLRWLEVLPL